MKITCAFRFIFLNFIRFKWQRESNKRHTTLYSFMSMPPTWRQERHRETFFPSLMWEF